MNNKERLWFLASMNDVYLYAFDDTGATMLSVEHLTQIKNVIHDCITTRFYDEGTLNYAEVLRRGVVFLAYARIAVRDGGAELGDSQ